MVATASETCASYGGALQGKLASPCPGVVVDGVPSRPSFFFFFLTHCRMQNRNAGWCSGVRSPGPVFSFVVLYRVFVSGFLKVCRE